ncbi:MAG: aspartate--tRNA ligase, partial [Phycisphaeraceae bacterium]|nr:aspartate--tRNA ligase [Phycisphaeraceae bacterium]
MTMTPRTHDCGALRQDHVGQTVTLAGWVNSYRDHGGVVFIDLRDRKGVTQIVFHPENADAHQLANSLRHEDVLEVTGQCVKREAGMENPRLATGQIEVQAKSATLLNKAQTPPFTPDEAGKVNEETRLKYRYVDLRRPRMQEILAIRHRTAKVIRDYFDEQGFLEIETPFLCRSTPEGARDFLVPSRVIPGSFYALPQSPQLYKQVLMASGCEKYVQLVRCFRDEDPRADR